MPLEAQGPYTLIPIPNAPIHIDTANDIAGGFGLEMALAHNIMIRTMNSIWKNAPHVTAADSSAFAGYGLACLKMIHMHHHGEEEIVFPRLQAKLDMGHNVDQHEAFQGQMQLLQDYFTRVHKGEEKHDAETTRRLLNEFADPLVEHLHEELATITAEKLSVFTYDELAAINKALENYIKSEGGFFTILPFGLTAHSRRDAPEWPPIPAPIKWFALNIGYYVNRSYWKFAPFSRTGEPQIYTG